MSGKLNAEWTFLLRPHDSGQNSAKQWVERNLDALGARFTPDIDAVYLN